MSDPIIDTIADRAADAIAGPAPAPPPPGMDGAIGNAWSATTPLREIGRAVGSAYGFTRHSAQAIQAERRGDHDAAEDALGESLMDLAQGIPVLGGGVSLVRRGHDYVSRRFGGPTLGQRVGRSGPHTDVSDIEASDRIQRGDTQPLATGGNDNDRRRRNRDHEARVQEHIRRQQQQQRQREQAQRAEAARRGPDPMNTDVIAADQHARDLQQRAATANTPSYDMNRAFRPIATPRLGPTGYPTVGAEITLPPEVTGGH